MNETNLKVAALSLDIIEGDIAANLRCAENTIAKVADESDLIVLPEMFNTGFITEKADAEMLAESDNGQTLKALSNWAVKYDIAIIASSIVVDNGHLYNRCYFVDNSGATLACYDKHHLFAMSPESSTFTEGTSLPPTVSFKGFNIAMAVCYDLRFPVWLRNTNAHYDILVVTASWPDSRIYAWRHLLIARAIENQSYVVGCNRSGADRWGEYSGSSLIISPKGHPIGDIEGLQARATFSLDQLLSFRQKFPVCLHGDKFEIL